MPDYSQGLVPGDINSGFLPEPTVPDYKLPPPPTVNFTNQNSTEFKPVDYFSHLADNKPTTAAKQMEPTKFDWDGLGTAMYKNAAQFKDYGLSLTGDNEETYGQLQTGGDRFKRAIAGAWELGKNQFIEQLTSWGDTLNFLKSNKSAFEQSDMDEINSLQKQTEDKYHIFQTQADQDTFWNWANVATTVQQSGYALGAVAEILAEEAATQVLVSASMGALSGLEGVSAARAVKNGASVAKALDKVEEFSKLSNAPNRYRKVFNTINGVNPFGHNLLNYGLDAGNLYKASQVADESVPLLRTLGKGFGAFYKDTRALNAAVAEAKAEAAGVQQGLTNTLIAQYKSDNGKDPDATALADIQNTALKAGQTDGIWNTYLIMLTDRIGMGNIMDGFKPLRDLGESAGRKILELSDKQALKQGTEGAIKKLVDASENKWLAFKQNLIRRPIGYLKTNIDEALQENMQNVIQDVSTNYYAAKYNQDKGITGHDPMKSMHDYLINAASSQFTMSGMKTFMSAFMTGSILGPINNLVGNSGNIGQYFTDREGYNSRQEAIKKQRTEIINSYNDIYNNPLTYGYKMGDSALQANFGELLKEYAQNDDIKGFQDIKDDATRHMILTGIHSGAMDAMLKRYNNLPESLSPEEFTTAFGLENTPANVEALKNQIKNFTERAKEIQSIHENVSDRLQNPFNPWHERFNDVDKKTDLEWLREVTGYNAWNDAVDNMVFMKDYYNQTVKRSNSILSKIIQKPGFENVAFNDIHLLTNKDNISTELSMLDDEIKGLEEATKKDAATTKLLNEKKERNKLLTKYYDLLAIWDDQFDENSTLKENKRDKANNKAFKAFQKAATPLFTEFVNTGLQQNGKALLTNDLAKDGFVDLHDYMKLQKESGIVLDKINLLADPKNFNKFFQDHDAELRAYIAKAQEEHDNPEPVPVPEEKPVPKDTIVNDLGTKKADIEKRRQKELSENSSLIESSAELWRDDEDRYFIIATMKDGKKRIISSDEDGKRYGLIGEYPKENVDNSKLINNGIKIDKDVNLKTDRRTDKINAKYDAELKTLETKSDSTTDSITKTQAAKIAKVISDINKANKDELAAIFGDIATSDLAGNKDIQNAYETRKKELNKTEVVTPEPIDEDKEYSDVEKENLKELNDNDAGQKPDTAWSTTGKEDLKDNKGTIDSDPVKRLFYDTLDKLRKLKKPFNLIELIKGRKGVQLVAINPSNLFTESVNGETRLNALALNSLEKNTIDNIQNGKYKIEDFMQSTIAVLADNDGKPYKFNGVGEVTDNGNIITVNLRKPYLKDGIYYLENTYGDQIQSPEEIAHKITKSGGLYVDGKPLMDTAALLKIATEAQQKEFKLLYNLRQELKNPVDLSTSFPLPIIAITPGALNLDFKNPSKLSEFDIPGFKPEVKTINNKDSKRLGGVYFRLPDYDRDILIVRPKVSAQQAETVMQLITNRPDNITAEDALKFINSLFYTNNKDIQFYIKDGNIVAKNFDGEKMVDVLPDTYPSFLQKLQLKTLNIDKEIINQPYKNITWDGTNFKVETINYDDFIKNNFLTYVNPDNVTPLNAYIKFDTSKVVIPEKLNRENDVLSTDPTGDDIEAKIADIEKRRQEELKPFLGEDAPRAIVLQQELDELIKEKDEVAKRNQFNNDSFDAIMDPYLQRIQDAREAIKKEDAALTVRDKNGNILKINSNLQNYNNINAKYDAELAALNQPNQVQSNSVKLTKEELKKQKQEELRIANKLSGLDNLVGGVNNSISGAIGKTWRQFIEEKYDKLLNQSSQVQPDSITTEPKKLSVEQKDASLDSFLAEFTKLASVDNTATPEQIKAAEKWWKESPLSKHIPLERMMNVVNSTALATWTKQGITLYSGANSTDIYHEAFHGFSQLFLTKEQKNNLYNEARKVYPGLTNLEAEELLAEDFRKYVLSDGKLILDKRPVRNTLWRKILNFIREFFGGVSHLDNAIQNDGINRIKETYEQLRTGKIQNLSPSVYNINFGQLNKLRFNDGSQLSFAESKLVTDSIDSMIVDAIDYVNSGLAENNKPSTNILLIQENKKFINALHGSVKNKFINKAASGTEYQKVIAKKVLENLNEVLKYHAKKSPLLNASKIVIQEFDEDGNLVEKPQEGEEKNTRDSAYDKGGNEISLDERGDPEVFALLAGLFNRDKDGNTELNELGEKKLVDFTRTKSRVKKVLVNKTDERDMYDALVKASVQYPELTQLFLGLGDPRDYENNDSKFRLWMKLRQTYAMSDTPIHQMHILNDEDGNIDVRLLESKPDIQKVKQQFTSNFQSALSSPYIYVNDNGNNVLNVKQLLKKFADFKERNNNIFVTIKEGKRKEFLDAIGFKFSDKPKINAGIESFKNFDYLVQKLYNLDQQNREITDPIRQMEEPGKDKNGKPIKKDGGESNNISYLVSLEAQYSDDYSNYSVVNPNGDKVFELSEYNGLTMTASRINDVVKFPTYQRLIQEPDMYRFDINRNPLANGLILNSLFDLKTGERRLNDDGTPVTLEAVNLGGAKIITDDAVADTGVGMSGLDMEGKQLFDMNAALATGVEATPQHEAKSSYYGIKLSKIWNTEKTDLAFGYNYFPIKTFLTKGRLHTDVTDYLKLGLIGELTRTGWLNEGLASDDPAIREKGGADIEGYNKRAKSLTLFDGMLSEGMKARLLKIVEKNTPDNIADQVNALTDELHQEFSRYFGNMITETWNQVKDNFVVGKGIMDKLSGYIASTHGKDSTTTLEKQQILTKSYAINSFVAKMESYKVFYGDPAFYNLEKEEANKRIAGFGSTKSTLSLTPASIDYINNQMGRQYAKSLGIPEKKFNGTFDTRIYQDVKVDSALIEDLRKHFTDYFTTRFKNKSSKDIKELVETTLKPYTEMKEADAQGYITFDSWRILKNLQGQWNDEMELLYYKEIDGDELTEDEFDKFFSVVKGQYTGPLQTSHLYVPAFHKYSLMPLLPSMIRGTALEAINHNMMEQGHDYMTFESGSKIATIGKPQPMYSDLATRTPNIPKLEQGEVSPFVTNTIDLHYFGEQLKIDNHWKDEVIFSTQLRKLIDLGLYNKGVAVDASAEQKANEFVKLIDQLSALKKEQLIRQAKLELDKDGNYVINDFTPLVQLIKKEFENRNLPEQVIEFIDLTKDGKIKTPLDLSTQTQKIEGVIQSIINNRLIRQKVNGEPLIQLASTGFERFRNATEAEKQKYKSTNDLPFYHKEGRAISKLPKINLTEQQSTAINDLFKNNEELNRLFRGNKELYQSYLNTIFPNSKVKDIVYRGTPENYPIKKGISPSLGEGITFTSDRNWAKSYTEGGTNPTLHTALINIKNPITLKDNIDNLSENEKDNYIQQKATKSNDGTISLNEYLIVEPEQIHILGSQKDIEQAKEFIKNNVEFTTSAMKIKIALRGDYLNLLKLKHPDSEVIGTRERLNEAIKNEEWLDQGDNRKIITLTGVRIPVQGLNSMEFMEVYEFLPSTAGNVIIPASEIVAKSGSDFDVDKLSVFKASINDDGSLVKSDYNSYAEINSALDKEITAKRALISNVNSYIAAHRQEIKDVRKIKNSEYQKLKTAREYSKIERDIYLEEIRDILNSLNYRDDVTSTLKTFNTQEDSSNLMDAIFQLNDEVDLQDLDKNLYNYYSKLIEVDNSYKEANKIVEGYEAIKQDNQHTISEVKNKELEMLFDYSDKIRDLFTQRRNIQNATANELSGSIRSILEMDHNYIDLMKPNTTKDIEPLSDDLEPRIIGYKSNISKVDGEAKFRMKDGKKVPVVSATNLIEPVYNHQQFIANNNNKSALGIEAVDNTFNNQFNKVGAYLQSFYKNSKNKDVPVQIYLNHNKLTVNGKEHISLSHLEDANREHQIADIIQQLMNGSVDAGKKAWKFNINGGSEAASVILLLVQAGTPIEDVCYYMTQPVIQQYTKLLRTKNNLFSQVADPDNYKFFELKQRVKLLAPLLGRSVDEKIPLKHGSRELRYSDLVKQISGSKEFSKLLTDDNLFTLKSLKEIQTGKLEQAALLYHYFQLEDTAKQITDVKRSLNFDTNKSQSAIDAELKMRQFEDVKKTGILSTDVLNNLHNNSVISSFAIQKFNVDFQQQVLPLRNSKLMNNFILQKRDDLSIESRSTMSEKFARVFKNDFIEFAFQNSKKLNKEGKIVDQLPDDVVSWFRGPNTVANQLWKIKQENPDLVRDYPLLNNLIKDRSKRGWDIDNIKLIVSNPDTDQINIYTEQFSQLINPDVKKVADSVKNAELSAFFNKLAVFGFLQSGLNKSFISWTEIIPQDLYTRLMNDTVSAAAKKFANGTANMEKVEEFYRMFRGQNAGIFHFTTEQDQYSEPIPIPVTNPEYYRGKNYRIGTNEKFAVKIEDKKNAPIQKQVVSNIANEQIQGINISTKSDDPLGRALTNPTWGSKKDGKNYYDVETIYKANASKIKAPHLSAADALKYDMNIMYQMQIKKFRQNPELIEQINQRGGLSFIENSSHIVGVKGSRWEGKGMDSNFIKVLAAAYKTVNDELNTPANEQKTGFKLSIDKLKKDQGKADLANAFIGQGEPGTSTAQYKLDAQKAGIPVNGLIKPDKNTVAFVSVNGNNKLTPARLNAVVGIAKDVIAAGGTIIMDNTKDAQSSWNKSGEGLVQDKLGDPSGQTSMGYNYWGGNPEKNIQPVQQGTLNFDAPSVKAIGQYVKFNNETYIVTKVNSNGTIQVYNPTKEGTDAKKSVAERNLTPIDSKAEIVNYKDADYIVTPKNTIISLTTNKKMNWGNENGDRIAILKKAAEKFEKRGMDPKLGFKPGDCK